MNRRVTLSLLLIISTGLIRAADVKAVSTPDPKAPAAPAAAAASPRTAPAAAAPRNDSSVAPVAPYENFRVIAERNIFNPNRTGRRETTVAETPPRLDIITLVGTMDSDKGLRAFFDGSTSAYRKALFVGGSVDNFKVTKVAPNTVDLEREGKTLSVRVGQQLRRPEGSDWSLVGEDLARAEAAQAARATTTNSAPAIPADASDLVKKMMERRQNQNKP